MTSFYFFVGGIVLGCALGFCHGIDFQRQQGRHYR